MHGRNTVRVTYAKAVHGREEEESVLRVLRNHKTILGDETYAFEKNVAKHFGKKYGIMVNSGSSANLLAVELLNLPESSEVITPLLTFSTSLAPLLMKKLVPVFTDVVEGTYLMNISQVEKLITRKTKALFVPLLLGNVPDMEILQKLAKKHKLLFVEDSCDTLGATFKNKKTGVYSDISTTSFYGSHIITAGGGGGMVMVDTKQWRDRAKVLRGWGRGSALIGESESIAKRYKTRIGAIPYDAKFVFSEIGYNFLYPEMGAAFGNAQLKKLEKFRRIRENNFARLHRFFTQHEDYFILPKQDRNVRTQWLCFPLTIRMGAPFDRFKIVTYLEKNNIQTRPIFGGNILKQPGFQHIRRKTIREGYPVTDSIMKNGFVIGCHHGMTDEHLSAVESVFNRFLTQ